MNKANKIARTPPSSCLSDRPAGELFLPALRPVAIIDDQTDDGRAGGATHRFGARGCDRHSPAHRQGRVHVGTAGPVRLYLPLTLVPDTLTTNWPGLRSRRSLSFNGIGGGCRRDPFANLIQSRREGVLKRISQRLPRHLRKSFRVSVASTTTKPREAMNAVPKFREAGSSHDR